MKHCNGACATGADVGLVEYATTIVTPHPSCPLHGTGSCELCGSDDPKVQKVRGPGQRYCPDSFHEEWN